MHRCLLLLENENWTHAKNEPPKNSKKTNQPGHFVVHQDQISQEKEDASAEPAMSKAARQLLWVELTWKFFFLRIYSGERRAMIMTSM